MTDAFLQSVLDNPKDDSARLVYADWLEENAAPDAIPKAEFLRLTVALATEKASKNERKASRKRLQKLAAELDTGWLAVVSRMPVENCRVSQRSGRAPRQLAAHFQFLCNRNWEDLQTTNDTTIRFCNDCQKNVHYCDTIVEARNQADRERCVAVDLGVIRREGDLAGRMMVLGRLSDDFLSREDERLKPDPVSAEREKRKREAGNTK